MNTPVKVPVDLLGADIFKEIQAKLNVKKKEMGCHGYRRKKPPADLTGANIFKEDTSKARRGENKWAFIDTPVEAQSPCRPYWGQQFQSGYKQS